MYTSQQQWEYDEQPTLADEYDLVKTDIPCPECKELLFSGTTGNSPDDYISFLTCLHCHYYEQE